MFEVFQEMSNNVSRGKMDRRLEPHLLFSVFHVLVVRVCGGVGEVGGGKWERKRQKRHIRFDAATNTSITPRIKCTER